MGARSPGIRCRMCSKQVVILLLTCLLAHGVIGATRAPRRVNIPLLGIGAQCSGCPPHFCDDDPAIVLGYCCGCARFFDYLPVQCPPATRCPLNNFDLCHDYEYMMYCCCH